LKEEREDGVKLEEGIGSKEGRMEILTQEFVV
jgi:hypothetical protein